MSKPEPITIDYTNHRGERRVRTVIPDRVRWGFSPHHPEPCQWFLVAFDVEKQAYRDFALRDIHCWGSSVLERPIIDERPTLDDIRLIRLTLHADDPERATVMIDELASRLGLT